MLGLSLALVMQAGTPAPSEVIPEARWKRVPSIYERALAYPSSAAEQRIKGAATLRCRVTNLGSAADCKIYSETPKGYGFGKALMSLRSKMAFYPPAPGEGPWVLVTVTFDPDPKKALLIH